MEITQFDKKEIKSLLERMIEFIDSDVDDWYWKKELQDQVEQLWITLSQKGII